MRGVAGVTAAVVLAVVQCDLAAADTLQGGRDGSTFLYFVGADLWRDGSFLHGGLLWSPGGLDHEGFTFKAMISGGTYRYRSGALGDVEVTGRQLSASLMPGWRLKRDGFTVTLFAGLDAQDHRLSPDDPGGRLRGAMFGLRGGFDLWYQPTPTTMLAIDASVSSIGSSYSARLAYGWHVFDWFYTGPEALAFACQDYRQFRFGVHMTGLKTDLFEWSASAGPTWDSDHRNGIYGRLGLIARR
jgi:hypothetical protein